jgi:hypothetical protein
MSKNIVKVKSKNKVLDEIETVDVKIKKVVMKNLSEVTRAFMPFVDDFESIVDKDKGLTQTDMLDLISKHSNHTMALATILTNKEYEFFEELEPIEFFKVMSGIVEYSGDFFLTQILIPSQKLAKRIILLGLTANSYSKNTATEEKKL